jgi:guanylate kinase
VLQRRPDLARVAVSATTRPQREGERDGREYFFLSDAEFQRRVDNDEFEEHVSFAGGRYGTLKSEVDRLLAEGSNVILELEVEGAFAIRRRRRESVLIFIDAPVDELERRLRERNTESAGDIEMRLQIARDQMTSRGGFDHVVQNDDAEEATERLLATMLAELVRNGGPSKTGPAST